MPAGVCRYAALAVLSIATCSARAGRRLSRRQHALKGVGHPWARCKARRSIVTQNQAWQRRTFMRPVAIMRLISDQEEKPASPAAREHGAGEAARWGRRGGQLCAYRKARG